MTQISDEMVERALDGFHGLDRSALPPTDHGFRWADSMHTSMRRALSAALGAAPAAEAVTGRDADTAMVRVAVAFNEDGNYATSTVDVSDQGIARAWHGLAFRGFTQHSCIATIPAPRPVVAEVGASVEGVDHG